MRIELARGRARSTLSVVMLCATKQNQWLRVARAFLVLILLLLCTERAQAASTLSGAWTGVLVKQDDPLAVTITFARSERGWVGAFNSDDQQAAGIPLGNVRQEGSAVHFELSGDEGTTVFDGTLGDNGISGTFTDGRTTGSFRLTGIERPPPPLLTREVVFSNATTDLAGTLILPRGSGRHPAILFLHGSGPEGRWANRWLAEQFANAGFVALVFDKRGVGASSGNWEKVGFDILAKDGAAGVTFLRSQPEVASDRVGIYGHSQGGSIAPLVDAEAGGLAFIIASAAPGLTPAEVETYSVGNSIGISDLPPGERADAAAYVSAIIDVAYRSGQRSRLDALADAYRSRSWYFAPPPPESSYWTISRAIAAFDPAAAWARVRAPVLLVYGSRDERVPAEPSLEAIRSALRRAGNDGVSVKLYPEADHIFAIVRDRNESGWSKREPDYAAILTRWAAAPNGNRRAE